MVLILSFFSARQLSLTYIVLTFAKKACLGSKEMEIIGIVQAQVPSTGEFLFQDRYLQHFTHI